MSSHAVFSLLHGRYLGSICGGGGGEAVNTSRVHSCHGHHVLGVEPMVRWGPVTCAVLRQSRATAVAVFILTSCTCCFVFCVVIFCRVCQTDPYVLVSGSSVNGLKEALDDSHIGVRVLSETKLSD